MSWLDFSHICTVSKSLRLVLDPYTCAQLCMPYSLTALVHQRNATMLPKRDLAWELGPYAHMYFLSINLLFRRRVAGCPSPHKALYIPVS